jgi:hypothetical protein
VDIASVSNENEGQSEPLREIPNPRMEAFISIIGSSNGGVFDAESDVLMGFLPVGVLRRVGKGLSVLCSGVVDCSGGEYAVEVVEEAMGGRRNRGGSGSGGDDGY